MTATQRHSVLAAGALALELNKYLEAKLKLPELDLPDLRDEGPEEAAAALRAYWQLGERPVSNMIHLLESRGVRVFSLAEDCREVDAYSVWSRGRPFVFLNTSKSGERGRFDAAHELGHLVLHQHGQPTGRQGESEADAFAAAFLMPHASVIARAPRVPSLDRLVALKRQWKVSVAALIRRLHDTGMMSRWQYDQACIELSRRGWRTMEPEGIARESSQLLAKAFACLRRTGDYRSDIAEALDMYPDDLDALVFHLVLVPIAGHGRARPGGGAPTPPLRLVSG